MLIYQIVQLAFFITYLILMYKVWNLYKNNY